MMMTAIRNFSFLSQHIFEDIQLTLNNSGKGLAMMVLPEVIPKRFSENKEFYGNRELN